MVNGPAVDEPEVDRDADHSEAPDELESEPPSGRRSLWSRRSRPNGSAGTMFDEVAGDDGSEEGAPVRARSVPWPIVAVVGLCALALVSSSSTSPSPGFLEHGSSAPTTS
jgi:hypothetical protein